MKGFVPQLKLDLQEAFPTIKINNEDSISKIFYDVYIQTMEKFIFVFDEWDYIFNGNLFSENDRKDFLQFLKMLLKDKPYVELAYMTGVLPIAKYSSGSDLNMFEEYTFLNDSNFDRYLGFTMEEAENLCKKQKDVTFKELKNWYNGYKTFSGLDILNPWSVICALSDGICQSYWTNTGPMDEILYYINNDVDSVKNDIVQMISDIPLQIELKGYNAEQPKLNNRNQILSAMTTYGFLSYDGEELRIPNKEIKMKFSKALNALEDSSRD
jgi:hypothetical protein